MTHKLTRLAGAGMLACLLSAGLATNAGAQTILPPNEPEHSLAPTPYGMATINTAMMECPNLGGTFAAVVASDFAGANLYLNYGNGTVLSGPIPITTGAWAMTDVTIGDDMTAPGDRYIVTVCYREVFSAPLYNIYVRRYVVEDLAGAMTVTASNPVTIGLGDNPKIDNIADPANPVGPFPGMTQFLATYALLNNNTVGYHRANMDFTGAQPGTITLQAGFKHSDAAAVRDLGVNGGDIFVYVSALGNSNTELRVYEKNLNATTPATFTTLQTGLLYGYYSRIEAFGLRDAGAGLNEAKWAVTTSNALRRIMLYTNLTPPYYTNPQAYFNTSSQEYPALASGIGSLAGPSSNIGNSQYTYAWGAPAFGNYYSQALRMDGVPIAPNDFHKVNNTPCSMLSDPTEVIALCNSANSGTDLFVAWNQGGRVMYKQLNNSFLYRPTPVKDAQAFASLTVSPNPATDRIIIRTTEEVTDLSIVNSVGALVLRKAIKTGETTVDIGSLFAGTYFVHISGKNGTTTKPLVVVR